MRESRPEGDLQHDGPSQDNDQPRVIVAVAGESREIECDYEKADFIFEHDYGSMPKMFNSIKSRRSYDMAMYMGAEYGFASESSLSEMVNTLWNEDMIGVGAIYCDVKVNHGGQYICTKYNPPYTKAMYEHRVILNVPFLAKRDVWPEFNEEVSTLYLWDGMLWLMRHTLLFHSPKTLLKIDQGLKTPPFGKDVELIHGTHY